MWRPHTLCGRHIRREDDPLPSTHHDPTGGTNPARLTVVTGPAGVDIGPVAAHLGRDLGDGLAIRTVVSGRPPYPHTSPDPHHRHTLDGTTGCRGTGDDPCMTNRVRLLVLPSAWQNPDTNLGVAYTGIPVRLPTDLGTLDALGLHPGHRVTVQHDMHWLNGDQGAVPAPIEVGNLAEHARDSIWRGARDEHSSRHVLVEAGDGQTFLDALHTAGIPPWTPYVEHIELWMVLDARTDWPAEVGDGAVELATDRLTARIGGEVFRNGGGPVDKHGITMRVAVLNVDRLVPGLAGKTTAGLAERTGPDHAAITADDQAVDQLARLLVTISNTTGASITPVLFTTGTDPGCILDLR